MAEGAQPASAGLPRALPACAALLLIVAGCAQHPQHSNKQTEAQMLALLAVLPGTYDNSAQAELEARNGARPAHVAVALTITHVFAPRLGHYVYYAQETAADDPRRVLTQKIFSFQFDEKQRAIIETLYQLVEPLRWRDGQLNKDLFTSLVTEDVQAEGCQLFWKKKDADFVATHDPKVCPDAAGGAALPLAEFSAGVLTIGEYKFRKIH
ncbi:MAG TPA: CpcT/CpeT family chromophore lyase [Steroidobacteraceae bacterium]|jgi:hypothetical protein|nr:CpcT/CpeT family chromophore lyase [Steroidobacteraceae bacterium]